MAAPVQLDGYTFEKTAWQDERWQLCRYQNSLGNSVDVLDGVDAGQSSQVDLALRAQQCLSHHPALISIDTVGCNVGHPYLVLQASSRVSPAQYPVATVLSTAIMCAGAVATAHSGGVLHRLVNPTNLFRSEYGWLQLGPGALYAGQELLIPPAANEDWTAPEERGHAVDERADVFGIATVCSWLLSGQSDLYAPLTRADVPQALLSLVQAGLSIEASNRPSVDEFVTGLQRIEQNLGLSVTNCDVDSAISDELRALLGNGGQMLSPSGLWRHLDDAERTEISERTVLSERQQDHTIIVGAAEADTDDTVLSHASQAAHGVVVNAQSNDPQDSTLGADRPSGGTQQSADGVFRYEIRKIEVPVSNRIRTPQQQQYVQPRDSAPAAADGRRRRLKNLLISGVAVAVAVIIALAAVGIVLLLR